MFMGKLPWQHYLWTLIGMQIICILDPLNHRAKGWDWKNVNFKILGNSDISWNLKNSDKYRSFVYTVQFSRSVMYNSLRPCRPQHARLPCPSPTPRACSVSCWLSRWCHPTILSSVVPFSSCLLSKHQGLFQWVSSSHQVAKILELQHQFFQWIFRTDFFYDWLFWSPCSPRDSQESSPTIEFKSINS